MRNGVEGGKEDNMTGVEERRWYNRKVDRGGVIGEGKQNGQDRTRDMQKCKKKDRGWEEPWEVNEKWKRRRRKSARTQKKDRRRKKRLKLENSSKFGTVNSTLIIPFWWMKIPQTCQPFCVWTLTILSCCQVMNAARIHDKQKLKSFWEQRIVQHCEQMDKENNRVRSSSLTRSDIKMFTRGSTALHFQTLKTLLSWKVPVTRL